MSVPIWVEIVSKLATPGIGAVSAFYVFLQYRRAQRWKAADLAAILLERLSTDQALALACQALDWGVGPLIIPDQYRPLFPPNASSEAPGVMEHDPKVLSDAVQPGLSAPTLADPRGLVYRYCFDKLFAYLDNMFKLLADGQLREGDIEEVKYWLESFAITDMLRPRQKERMYFNLLCAGGVIAMSCCWGNGSRLNRGRLRTHPDRPVRWAVHSAGCVVVHGSYLWAAATGGVRQPGKSRGLPEIRLAAPGVRHYGWPKAIS
jgi:hypothetical protein